MERRVGATTAALLAAVVLALAGCAHPAHPGPARDVPDDPVRAAADLPDAPAWVAHPSGTDCGTVRLDEDLALPASGRDCLAEASAAGRDAVLRWVLRTTEGDPVPHFARTDGHGGAVVASTSAWDAYGADGWTEYRCAVLADLPYGESCTSDDDG